MHNLFVAGIFLIYISVGLSKQEDNVSIDNNIIDFDEEYSLKIDKKYKKFPYDSDYNYNKNNLRYTYVKEKQPKNYTPDGKQLIQNIKNKNSDKQNELLLTTLSVPDHSEDSTEYFTSPEFNIYSDYSTVRDEQPKILHSSTDSTGISTTDINYKDGSDDFTTETLFSKSFTTDKISVPKRIQYRSTKYSNDINTVQNATDEYNSANQNTTSVPKTITQKLSNETKELESNLKKIENASSATDPAAQRYDQDDPDSYESDVPIFTELDLEHNAEVPEDYYDSKDVVPTRAPDTSALGILFGLAGSVVESVAEKVVPKGVYDLFKRMQRQSEALEAERLRSREENGGLGQFGRGILKSISSGLSKPLSQLMAGAKDIGSLDNDRRFLNSLASGVTNVANVATSVVDNFKDKVKAIYPGTLWCGDGHSAAARSGELGLFFFTDTCCRQHDACKMFIRAGETRQGLTNTGIFTRSHCSCDATFRACLQRTGSLISTQIGITYFNVLGPQCFRRAHPILRCLRRTRLTSQKCEEYELDYTKPKMWQWFDNETF